MTYSDYTQAGHSQYSYIVCSGTSTCTSDVTEFNPIYVKCSAATCTSTLTTMTGTVVGGKKVYPKIECLGTTGSCTNTVKTADGVDISCSN